jgi:hypothetical protein
VKAPFANCCSKSQIRMSYHHLLSNSEKVTALRLHIFFEWAADIAKTEIA